MALSGNQPNYDSILKEQLETAADRTTRRFRLRWIPTSSQELAASEKQLLKYLNFPHEIHSIHAGQIMQPPKFYCQTPKLINVTIRTLIVNKTKPGIPLLLLHGLGLALGTFIAIINASPYQGPVYAIDLPGFGRSTRFRFPKNSRDAEDIYIKLLEGWRRFLNIEKVVIAGLSFGGFLGTSYALKYPERVHHLVLLDPWGFPQKPEKVTSLMGCQNQFYNKTLVLATKIVNVSAPYRILGPCGPKQYAGEIKEDGFQTLFGIQSGATGCRQHLDEYLYHCMAGKTSGENSFRSMMTWIVYAKQPLCRRLHTLNLPLTMLYPEDGSFLPSIPGDELQKLVGTNCSLNVYTVPSTNHENILFSKKFEEVLKNV